MKTTTLVLALGLTAALTAPAGGDAVDDDLAVVKKATASTGSGPAVTPEARPLRPGDEPQWLRVRIVEKGKKKATLKVNLPLVLLRAVEDDVPIPGCEREHDLTLRDVLRALDSGENLVEIEDDDATVRVWVE
jgi:hypothetical protein